MNGWNGCDLGGAALASAIGMVILLFSGSCSEEYSRLCDGNAGGGNCGVIHQCHVFEIFSDIRILRKNSEDEVTDSKYVSCIEHYSVVNFNQ